MSASRIAKKISGMASVLRLHDNHAELAQLRVRDPAQVRLLAEDHPSRPPTITAMST